MSNLNNLHVKEKLTGNNLTGLIHLNTNLKIIFENMNDLIILLNKEYEFVYVNKILLKEQLGYDGNDLIGKYALNYVHNDDSKQVFQVLQEGFIKNVRPPVIKLKHKEGHWVWFECKGNSHYDSRGTSSYLLILQNITSRIDAEEKYRSLFENSPNAILLLDFAGRIIDSNSTSMKLFGYSKEYLKGKFINQLTHIFPEIIKPYFKQIFKSSFKGEFPEPIEFEVETKSGKVIWVRIQASLAKISGSISIQFIFQDITVKKDIELLENKFKHQLEDEVYIRTKELNKALDEQKLYLDQIVKSSQFKSEFLATMSHELRTPLNAIVGFTELLLEEVYGSLTAEQLEFITDIKNSAEHQFEMIKKILDISKIEAGELTVHLHEFSLNNVINQIVSSLRPLFFNKNIKIKVKGLTEEKEIYADPIRFKEILYNLLSNAIKFTIEGKIILSIKENYKEWEFKIKDSGIGIAREDFDKIFKEFQRIDSSYVRSTPGTGLGLSLTKRLVNLHGGNISFLSFIGMGTTFTFTIPKKT